MAALDDPEIYKLLVRAIEDGRIELNLDPSLLTHVHSPVASDAEANLPLLLALLLAGLAGWWQGWTIGGAAALLVLFLYGTLGRRLLFQRLQARFRRTALADLDLWRRVWRFGGLSLRMAGPGGATCRAPGEAWQSFVLAAEARRPVIPPARAGDG